MQNIIRKLSIKQRLIWLLSLVTGSMVTAALLAVLYMDVQNLQQQAIHAAEVQGKILNQDFAKITVFGDIHHAADAVSKLHDYDMVLNVFIYDKKGEVVFSYKRSTDKQMAPPNINGTQHYFDSQYLHMFLPINYDGVDLGTTYMRILPAYLIQKEQEYYWVFGVSIPLLIIFSYLLALWMQTYFSRPIIDLAKKMEEVSAKENYLQPITNNETHEIGSVYNSFNQLLKIIRKNHQQLSSSEKKFRGVMESLAEGMLLSNEQGEIVLVNSALLKMTGYTEGELLGKKLEVLVPHRFSDHRKKHQSFLKSPNHRKMGDGLALHMRRKNGDEFPIDVSLTPVKMEGNIVVAALVQDITQRKKDEEEKESLLRSLEQQNLEKENILNSMLDGVVTINDMGLIQSFNCAAEVLFAYVAAEVVGENIQQLIAGGNTNNNEFDSAELSKNKNSIEFIVQRKNNSQFPARIAVAELPREAGDNKSFIVSFHDLTLFNQQQEQIQRSQKMQALSKLTGGIAHDFNNQLGVITGYLDILKDYKGDPEKAAMWIETANRSALRCIALTRQLQTFSQHKSAEKAPHDINVLLQNYEELVCSTLTPAIEIDYVLENELWITEIDDGDLQDAVLNIVLNARDAMSNGGQLHIETHNKHVTDKDADYIVLSIIDNGVGMDEVTREHIFEPFYTTKDTGKGTGLGLSMVYGFVQRSNGYVEVDSAPQQGCKISLYFPRSEVPYVAEVSKKNIPLLLSKKHERVLLVDDEIELLHLAEKYLLDLGYECRATHSAKEALKWLSEGEKFDVIFSDIVMPGGLNGYELAQKALQIMPQLNVLLATGHASIDVFKKWRSEISVPVLNKPYRKEELAQKIRWLLDNNEPHHVTNKTAEIIPEHKTYCVMVVDDEKDVRDLMALNLKRLGYDSILFEDGSEAVEYYKKLITTSKPIDVVIVDLSLQGGIDGLQVTKKILTIHAQAKLIVSSGYNEGEVMTNFKNHGFVGALEKNFNRENIEKLLHDVLN